jgi:hypothetical protein
MVLFTCPKLLPGWDWSGLSSEWQKKEKAMRSWRGVVPLALAAVLMLPGTASAQLDARDAPTVSGPLNAGQKGCDGGKEMHQGELVARVRLCYRIFLFDVDSEDSENRDYGVVWLQSNVDAEPGWCATAVRTSALISKGGSTHDYAPSDEIKAQDKKTVTRTLKVDAQGNADQNGKITQSFTMIPKRVTPTLTRNGDKERFKLIWNGSSARNLGFATGVEISWAQSDGSPQIDPKLTYDFTAESQGC